MRMLAEQSATDFPVLYPLSSILRVLSEAPALILFLNVVRVHEDEGLASGSHVRSHPDSYIAPPFAHPNMASMGAVMQSKKKVWTRQFLLRSRIGRPGSAKIKLLLLL